MAQGEVDIFDLVLFPLFFAFGLMNLSVVGPVEIPLTSVSTADALFSFGEGAAQVDVTISLILTLVPFLLVLITNEWTMSAATGVKIWLVILTVAVIVLPPFMPFLAYILQSYDAAAITALLIQSSGYVAVSYMG